MSITFIQFGDKYEVVNHSLKMTYTLTLSPGEKTKVILIMRPLGVLITEANIYLDTYALDMFDQLQKNQFFGHVHMDHRDKHTQFVSDALKAAKELLEKAKVL